MKSIRPKDGQRLELLLSRIKVLRRHDVSFRPEHIEALRRVVDIMRHDDRKRDAKLNAETGPPPGFGRLV